MEKKNEKFVIIYDVRIEVDSDRLNLANRNIKRISDIKGLDSLQNLKYLILANNNISKIENLNMLSNLEELDLSMNEIEEIYSLENLVNLKQLNLSQNHIQEIKGLDSLKNLEILNLSYNQINRIEGLNNLKNLHFLALFYNEISEIQNIDALENLKELYLDFNRIATISGLEKLANLENLSVRQNRISKIENINALSNLTSLDLSRNQISKIEGLEGNKNLKFLNLYMNVISEIQGLDHLTVLEELTLFDNNIKKIENLSNLKLLKKIDLMNNSISDMKGLEKLDNLEYLSLISNRISEINSIDNLKRLKHLLLADNLITEIKGFENLEELESLYLNYNELSQMKGLDNLRKLKRIDLSNNILVEMPDITKFESLDGLYLRNNKIKKISKFPRYISQFHLDLRENEIEDPKEFLKFSSLNLLNIDLYKMKYSEEIDIATIQRFIEKMINQYVQFYDHIKDRNGSDYDDYKKEELDDLLIGYNMRLLYSQTLSDQLSVQQEFLKFLDQRIAIDNTPKKKLYIGLKNLVLSLTESKYGEKVSYLLEAKESFQNSENIEILDQFSFILHSISLVLSSKENKQFAVSNIMFDLINYNLKSIDEVVNNFIESSDINFFNPIISQFISSVLEKSRTYYLDQKSPEKREELLKAKPPWIRNMLRNLIIEEIYLNGDHRSLTTLKIYFAQMNLKIAHYDLNTGEFYPNEVPQIITQIKSQLEKAKAAGSNFIIFPEYSFPKSFINHLVQFANVNKIWIVGGCERFDGPNCNHDENIALVIPPDKPYIIQKKRLRGKTEPPLNHGDDIRILHTEFGSFSVLICADFLEDYLLYLLKEKVDYIIVPSFNKNVKLFESNAMVTCVKNTCFIFINNVIQYPSSSIYAPYKGDNKKVPMRMFPYYEINLSEFRNHRLRIKPSKNFKPPLSRTLYA